LFAEDKVSAGMKTCTKLARYSRDPETNMGYVQLRRKIKGDTWRSVVVADRDGKTLFVLDLNMQGRLMGIECFDAITQLGPRP